MPGSSDDAGSQYVPDFKKSRTKGPDGLNLVGRLRNWSPPLAVAHQAPALHNTVLTTILSLLIHHVKFRINNILL